MLFVVMLGGEHHGPGLKCTMWCSPWRIRCKPPTRNCATPGEGGAGWAQQSWF